MMFNVLLYCLWILSSYLIGGILGRKGVEPETAIPSLVFYNLLVFTLYQIIV